MGTDGIVGWGKAAGRVAKACYHTTESSDSTETACGRASQRIGLAEVVVAGARAMAHLR